MPADLLLLCIPHVSTDVTNRETYTNTSLDTSAHSVAESLNITDADAKVGKCSAPTPKPLGALTVPGDLMP